MSAVIPSLTESKAGDRGQVAEEAISHLASLTAQRDREQLDGKMCKEGWTPVAHWRYAEEHHPRLLLLYQRSRPAGDDN